MIKLTCPVKIVTGSKKLRTYYLNLNNYRNWHYQVNNNLKAIFKELMHSQLKEIEPVKEIRSMTYVIFFGSKRRADLMNVGSVIDKFLCDALQEYNIIPDDDKEVLHTFKFEYGGIDKNNPRVEVYIDND